MIMMRNRGSEAPGWRTPFQAYPKTAPKDPCGLSRICPKDNERGVDRDCTEKREFLRL